LTFVGGREFSPRILVHHDPVFNVYYQNFFLKSRDLGENGPWNSKKSNFSNFFRFKNSLWVFILLKTDKLSIKNAKKIQKNYIQKKIKNFFDFFSPKIFFFKFFKNEVIWGQLGSFGVNWGHIKSCWSLDSFENRTSIWNKLFKKIGKKRSFGVIWGQFDYSTLDYFCLFHILYYPSQKTQFSMQWSDFLVDF